MSILEILASAKDAFPQQAGTASAEAADAPPANLRKAVVVAPRMAQEASTAPGQGVAGLAAAQGPGEANATPERVTWHEVREVQSPDAWDGHLGLQAAVDGWSAAITAKVKEAWLASPEMARLEKAACRATVDEASAAWDQVRALREQIAQQILDAIPDHSVEDQTYLVPVEFTTRVKLEPRGEFAAFEAPTTWTELEQRGVVVISQAGLRPGADMALCRPGAPRGRKILARVDAAAVVMLGEDERATIAKLAFAAGRLWVDMTPPPKKQGRPPKES